MPGLRCEGEVAAGPAQCREGWHLDEEPVFVREDPNERQRALMLERARLEQAREQATLNRTDTTALDDAIAEVEYELARSGVRGSLSTVRGARRVRSTQRRRDVVDLPTGWVEDRTVGRVYEAADGKRFRPSLFVTATLPSYGKVGADGTPVDPDAYDYRRAARDAIHFPKLVDRLVQNLRRVAGYQVQYFAAVEPQRRLAPHVHAALRGTLPRAELRQVLAATYHQVWWPPHDEVVYEDGHRPEWDEARGAYCDRVTGTPLPTCDEALDAVDAGPAAEPAHVLRFGEQADIQGVLAGSPDASRRIGYLAKYPTKDLAEVHPPVTKRQREHVDRLLAVLRYEPCSPTCANWLRYGVQPKNARPGMRPGFCRGRAHRPEHLGYGGRRVLVSRRWSGKTLADHKQDRRAWVLELLSERPNDEQAASPPPVWLPVGRDSPDLPPLPHRLLTAIATRIEHRHRLAALRGRPSPAPERSERIA